VINLIHQGTGPIFQAQYGLPPLTGAGGIGEESRGFSNNLPIEPPWQTTVTEKSQALTR